MTVGGLIVFDSIPGSNESSHVNICAGIDMLLMREKDKIWGKIRSSQGRYFTWKKVLIGDI